MGKGSAPRPYSVDAETFADNWSRTFGQAKSTDSLNKVEADNGHGSQPDAQGSRQAEGLA